LTGVGAFHLVDEIHHAVAPFAPQVGGGEAVHGGIGVQVPAIDIDEARKGVVGGVRLEADLLPYPFGTFCGDGFLCELVAEAYLEGGTIERTFAVDARYVELAPLLGHLVGREGGRGEDKTKLLNVLQLLFQLLESINGKTAGGHRDLTSLLDFYRQIVTECPGDVVYEFHIE